MDDDAGATASGSSDAGIFEITDFTNATQWESFIADLEGIFHQWELVKPDHDHECGGIQHRKTERIRYSNRTFVVTLEVEGRYREREDGKYGVAEWPPALHEMRSSSGDFPPRAHHLARWYGLSQFVVVCPTEGAESLHSQAQANLMLSSVSIAINNTGCTTPVFVQLHQPWRQVYVGLCESGRVRVNYSVTHLRHTPSNCNHLSGLLQIFKSKIQASAGIEMDPVQVAVRFLYVLRHWSLDDWPVEPLGDVEKGFDGDYLGTLRVGAFTDPVKELHLSAIWPKLTEELVTDTATFSDLNPSHAAVWTVSLHLTENASCILAETLLNFYQLCYRNGSVADMLGKASLWDEETSGVVSDSYSKPLDRLTSPGTSLASPLFHSVVYTATQRMESGRTAEENITEKDLDAVIKFLFPDAYQSNSMSHKTPGVSDLVFKLKSAPLDCLTGRLAKALAIVNTECGVKAMCRVWHEVTLELRYRWENGILLPNIPEGPPNMKCCLLHQKLQMLNCSIRHKVAHQHKRSTLPHRPASNTTGPSLSPPRTHTHNSTSTSTIAASAGLVGNEWKSHVSRGVVGNVQPTAELGSGKDVGEEERDPVSNVVSSTDDCVSSSDEDEFFEALEDHKDNNGRELHVHVSVEETASMSHARVEQSKLERVGEAKEDEDRIVSTSVVGRSITRENACVPGDSVPGESVHGDSVPGDSVPGDSGDISEVGGAMGRLRLCGDLVLVATGDPMYIPVTQDHAPLTEDHVWEQQAVMAQLGTSEEAARLRAKMQSSSLMSDMQAFKAANPGCLLEDFVRWYSPCDWEEGEREGGGVGEGEGRGEEGEGEGEGEEGGGVGEGEVEGEEGEGEGEEGGEGREAVEGEGRRKREGNGEIKREGEGERGEGEEQGRMAFDVEESGGDGWEGWGGGEWDVIGDGGEESSSGAQKTVDDGEVTLANDGVQDDRELAKRKFVAGGLSMRMRQPGSLWQEAWSAAEPVPAHRQKKLFNDTREAEKVLHYLAGLKTAELGLLVLPLLTHCAIHALKDKHAVHPLSASESHLDDAVSLLSSIPHPTTDSLPKYREVISLLSQTEHLQAAAHSLRIKLAQGSDLSGNSHHDDDRARGVKEERESEINVSVEVLLQEPELVLQDPTSSQTGLALQGLLVAQVASRDLEEQESTRKKVRVSPRSCPPPSGREFILRTTLPHPSPHSLPSPQRMYCVLTPAEFRLAGAFTTDVLIT